MKKSTLLTLYMLIALGGFAQQGFNIGLAGTFNATFIWRQDNYGTLAPFTAANGLIARSEMNYKLTWGGNGGFVLGYNFNMKSPKVSAGIEAELQYAETGQDYEDNFEGPAVIPEGTFGSTATRVNVQRTLKLGYLQIPLMAKITVHSGGIATFFLSAGPQLGFRTAAYEQVKIAGYVYLPDSIKFTSAQKFQTFDAGITLKFGAQIYATNHLFFQLGIVGYEGITDINGKVLQQLGWYDKNHVSYQKSHNATAGLELSIHYLFGKGANFIDDKKGQKIIKTPVLSN